MVRVIAVSLVVLAVSACSLKKQQLISFGSPEETFETWREAVERLDLETIVLCYADSAKQAMRQDIRNTTKDGLKAMQEETRDTQFSIEKIVYEGPKAFLRVKRVLKGNEEIEVVNMTLENGAWKLIP